MAGCNLMDAEPRLKRLKKTEVEQAEKPLSFKDLIKKHQQDFFQQPPLSLASTQESMPETPALEPQPPVFSSPLPASSSEASDSEDAPLPKKKKSARKAQAPALPKFNRLLSGNSALSTSLDTEIAETEYLRSAPLQLPQRPRAALGLDSLLAKLNRSDSGDSPLIKSLLTANDVLQLEASGSVGRLQMRRETCNPRTQLLQTLKQNAADRKTQHYSTEQLLQKSVSELEVKKANAEEDADSDYLPEHQEEEEEAQRLQWAIDLEEGVKPAESDTEEEPEESDAPVDAPALEQPAEEQPVPESPQEEEEEAESSDTESSSSQDDTESSAESLPADTKDAGEPSSEPQTAASSIEPQSTRPKRNRFIEEEAELGSDNEAHDDLARLGSDMDCSEDDAELPELIDNADVEEGETALKLTNDQMMRDHKELRQVINGEFRKRKNVTDYLEGDVTSKKQRLLEDTQGEEEMLPWQGNEGRERMVEEGLDEEDASRLQLLHENSRLKLFRRDLDRNAAILDEESQHYLSLMRAPSFSSSTRTLLPDSDKSNSIDRVFRDSSNSAANARAYVFRSLAPEPAPATHKPKRGRSILSLIK